MTDISVLYCGLDAPGTLHRYGRRITQLSLPAYPQGAAAHVATRRPEVQWDLGGQIGTTTCASVLDDLAAFGVPSLTFVAEPLGRADFFELAGWARDAGLRTSLVSDGADLAHATVRNLAAAGVACVEISLDTALFARTTPFGRACFEDAIKGLRACAIGGLKTAVRVTLTAAAIPELGRVFDLVEAEGVERVCFQHAMQPHGYAALSRQVMDLILDRTRGLFERGRRVEVQTADGAGDGPYIYLRMLAEGHPRAQQVREMLTWAGGHHGAAGVGVAYIDAGGTVHADAHSTHYSLGNVRDRRFSEIWLDGSDLMLQGLRDRFAKLRGRCRGCRFMTECGGGLRARAEHAHGDLWGTDPACYLSEEEVAREADATPEAEPPVVIAMAG